MALTTMDGLVAAFPAFGIPILKAGFSPQAVGCWTSVWAQAGVPGVGANSSSGVAGDVPTSATAGAFPFTNPTAPSLSYLARLAVASTQTGTILLYDRLWQQSGLSPTSLSVQTVQANTPTVPLTRPDALGAMAEAWFQVFGVLGAGSTAPTIVYTDQDANLSNTGTLQNFVTTAAANRTFPFALAAGDTGVRSIQSYTNGATMTSGTFGLIIRRQLAVLPVGVANMGNPLDAIGLGLPRVYDSACLEVLWMANAATSTSIYGALTLAQG